jgi:uncharacterized protein (DUF58 family)
MTRSKSPDTAAAEVQMQLNSRLLPWLIGLLLGMQLLFPYRGWMLLLAGLGGGWLAGYVWARALARGLRLTREMRFGWMQVGDRFEERFTLVNDSLVRCVWVEVVDHATVPGYRSSRVTGLGSRSSSQWTTAGVCERRGLFMLGPTSLRTGDPLGLYTVTLHYPQSTTLMVTPPVLPLPSIEVAPGGRAGEGQRVRADLYERTISAAGVRDYQPGDHPGWIHWPISAHRDELAVRLFDSTPTSDWWIFVDLDRRMQVGEGWHTTQEHGVMLAASLADRGLRSKDYTVCGGPRESGSLPRRTGRAVGLVTHGQELVWLPPQPGESQRLAISRALALVEPGDRPLSELLAKATPAPGQRPSLILITPSVRGDWIETLLPLVQRGVTPTVLLLDPVSFGGSDPVDGTVALLANWGIPHAVISSHLLDRPEARPGQRGQWEWRVVGPGRAVPVRRPQDLTWKKLQ